MSPESFKDSAFGDAWEKWSESFGDDGWDFEDFRNFLEAIKPQIGVHSRLTWGDQITDHSVPTLFGM